MDKKIFLVLSLWFAYHISFAQLIETNGKFLSDSVKIGEATDYVLTVKYPVTMQVIYPDSTFDFSPFEYYTKSFVPTKVDSIYAIDSVIYSLATFEIDPVQSLAIPIFILSKGDSVDVLPIADSIILKALVTHVPDTVNLKSNFEYLPVQYAVNYPYLAIGLVILFVTLIGLWIVFGKKIRAKIKLYRLKKSFEAFSQSFENGINKIKSNEDSGELIEEVLVIWKQYMEKLEDKPFTKYTSKEIAKAGYDEVLTHTLQNIDRAIYGHLNDDQMHTNFEALEDFTLQMYQLKTKKIING